MKRARVDRAPRALFVALLVLLFLLPWPMGANRDHFWPWFAAGAGLIAALAALGVALGHWRPGEVWRATRGLRGLVLASFALLVWIALVAWPAPLEPWDRSAALRQLPLWMLQGGVLLLALALIDSRRRLVWVMATMFASAALHACYAVAMTLSGVEWGFMGPKLINHGLATGTYVNRNHFAGMLEVGGAMGAGLLVAQLSVTEAAASWRARLRDWTALLLGRKTLLRGALALLVVALVLTQSRMGNGAFFGALTAVGLFALWRMRPRPRALAVFLASLLLLDLVVLGSWVGVERVAQRLRETTIVVDAPPGASSDAERVAVSAATLELWREAPWFGVGAGGFRSAFPSVKPESVRLFYDHAHNDWAQLFAERGVVGAALMLAVIVLALHGALRTLARRQDARCRGAAFGAAAAVIALAVHGLVDFNLQIPANSAWFHVALALGLVAERLPGRSPSKTVPSPSVDRSSPLSTA